MYGTNTLDAGKVELRDGFDADATSLMLAETVERGQRDTFEHIVAFDRASGTLHSHDGNANRVDFPPTMIAAARTGEHQFDLHHNHPGVPVSLSSQDTNALGFDGIVRVVAHTTDGSSFAATRGAWFHPMPIWILMRAAAVHAVPVFQASKHALFDSRLMTLGLVKLTEDAMLTLQHAQNQVLDALGIIHYSYHLSAASAARYATLPIDALTTAILDHERANFEEWKTNNAPWSWSSKCELEKDEAEQKVAAIHAHLENAIREGRLS